MVLVCGGLHAQAGAAFSEIAAASDGGRLRVSYPMHECPDRLTQHLPDGTTTNEPESGRSITPPAFTQALLRPIVVLLADLHQIDVDREGAAPLGVDVAPDLVADDRSAQSRLLVRLLQRGVDRRVTLLDDPLGARPTCRRRRW